MQDLLAEQINRVVALRYGIISYQWRDARGQTHNTNATWLSLNFDAFMAPSPGLFRLGRKTGKV